jgi:hypothetical protein
MTDREKFTDSDIVTAIRHFLQFGEDGQGRSHQGYYSGDGWAARVMRFHLDQLNVERAARAAPAQPAGERVLLKRFKRDNVQSCGSWVQAWNDEKPFEESIYEYAYANLEGRNDEHC